MRVNLIAAGISLAAVVVVGCGGAATPAPAPSDAPATDPPAAACAEASGAADVDVTIQDFSFDPNPVEAKVGQTIGWANTDAAPHTATLDDGSCATGTLAAGSGTGALVFSEPGEYPYHCAIHPTTMKATIVITN